MSEIAMTLVWAAVALAAVLAILIGLAFTVVFVSNFVKGWKSK